MKIFLTLAYAIPAVIGAAITNRDHQRRDSSLNSFAESLYDLYPECAKPCLVQTNLKKSCALQDTKCICQVPAYSSELALCITEKCPSEDVISATRLTASHCSEAGVKNLYWFMDSTPQYALDDIVDVLAARNNLVNPFGQETPVKESINPEASTSTDTTQLNPPLLNLVQLNPVQLNHTPGESTPAESTPAESTPVDSTPAESTPAESTPADSTPVNPPW